MEQIKLIQGDCLQKMDNLIKQGVSVDMVLTDPPYGTTSCKWDSVIPFEAMWERINKLIKPNGAVVLFGTEPFSSKLRLSNLKCYKYDWIWIKDKHSNFAVAKYQPLKFTENIIIFSKKTHIYNPIMTTGKPNHSVGKGLRKKPNETTADTKIVKNVLDGKKYPKNYLFFNREPKPIHPTQKPVALLEYIIKTYTQENELVLDFTMGSGSTGVACLNTNRRFIGIELDEEYFNIAKERIENNKKQLSTFD